MLSITKASRNSTFAPQAVTSTYDEKTETGMLSVIRTTLKDKGVPKQARELILKSWRSSTKKQYNGYLSKSFSFCGKTINPIQPSINEVFDFEIVNFPFLDGDVCLFVFVALRPKSTAMVIAGRSVHLTTLFPGQT